MRKKELKGFDINLSRIDAMARLLLSETPNLLPLDSNKVKVFGVAST